MRDNDTGHIDDMLRQIEAETDNPILLVGTIALAVDMGDPSTPGRALSAWQRILDRCQDAGDVPPEWVLDGDFLLLTKSHIMTALLERYVRRGPTEATRMAERLRSHAALANRPAWRARILYVLSVVLGIDSPQRCLDTAQRALDEIQAAGELHAIDQATEAALLAMLGHHDDALERFEHVYGTCASSVVGHVCDMALAAWADAHCPDEAVRWADRSLDALLVSPRVRSFDLERAIFAWSDFANDMGRPPNAELGGRAYAELDRLHATEIEYDSTRSVSRD